MKPKFIPLEFNTYPPAEMSSRATEFYEEMSLRRTVRDYSAKPVPIATIEKCLKTAGTAPSGANMQPWQFVLVRDSQVKKQIRLAAEKEEAEFYSTRASREWLDALAPLGTDEHKPFLETAPVLIAIFVQTFGRNAAGRKVKHYYASESVGIATGFLIAALHHAGLATLTHTPSPMGFLNQILGRPENERPFLLLVVGYPAEDAQVPAIGKKSLKEFVTFV